MRSMETEPRPLPRDWSCRRAFGPPLLHCPSVRAPTLIVLAAVVGLLAPLPLGLGSAFADGLTRRKDVMPVDQIKPGMKGYGLTVFEGTKPDKFDVEVIGVLENFRPRQELILIKAKHPRLDVAKVVAGMSGSPIFIGGKMVGAYAYGWTFGKEPVAGVTPIRSMLDDLSRPLPKQIDGWPLQPLPKKRGLRASRRPSSVNRFAGAPSTYDVRAHAVQVARVHEQLVPDANSPVRPVATPLLLGGMTPGAVAVARELFAPLGLEPLQAGGGGGTEASAPTRYVDGGAVGVELIRGDMSATGLGTVTRVEGDKLVAFGHPMMEAGVTALPTAVGRVLWFLASQMRSFKIGRTVRPVGALVNDRMASIVVSHSAQAPVIPVSMKIRGVPGAPFTQWNFEVAHEKFLSPSFLAVALGSALQATAAERQDVSWNAKSRLKIKGHPAIELEDFGVSVGGTPAPEQFIRSNLVRAVGMLLNNPWQPVLVERVEMEIQLRFAREVLRLRGAEVLESEIEAGQPARIRLTLLPYSGKPITRVISVPIPAHHAGKTLNLTIEPGYKVDKEKAPPERFSSLVQNLEDPVYPPKSIVVTYDTGDAAVAFQGHVVRNLPPGAFDTICPTTSSVAPVPFESQVRHVVKVQDFMTGQDRVSVTVKPVLR